MPTYSGPSIIDFLNSIGQDSSRASRVQLAARYGITNYTGTADQNTQLLNNLRNLYTSTGSIFPANPTPPPTPTTNPNTPTPPPGGWSSDPNTFANQMANLPAPTGTTPPITPPLPPTPTTSSFRDSVAYKALSADQRALVDLAFSTFSGTPEQQQIFADALTQAQTLADPYTHAQLTLALGEYQSQVAFFQGDLERASEVITRTRDQLLQDVSASKEFLTLEQQADISKETTKYGEDLLTIADAATEKGLTFATGARSRVLAEERRGTQFQDVIQSDQRIYNFKIRELELKASRGDIKAQKDLEDLRARNAFQLSQIGSAAETVLGTANLPSTPGYTPAGGVVGSIVSAGNEAIINAAGFALPS